MDIGALVGLFIGLFGVLTALGSVVAVVVSTTAVLVATFWFVRRIHAAQQRREEAHARLLREGRRCAATVLGVEQRSASHSGATVRVHLRVEPSGAEPWEASAEERLTLVQAPRVQPGGRVAVRVDPTDPARVAIELDVEVEALRFCRHCDSSFPATLDECPRCGAPV